MFDQDDADMFSAPHPDDPTINLPIWGVLRRTYYNAIAGKEITVYFPVANTSFFHSRQLVASDLTYAEAAALIKLMY